MIPYIILLIISTFAALICGFYFGYLKQEGVAPPMPKMPTLSEVVEDIKKRVQEPTEEEQRENQFYK